MLGHQETLVDLWYLTLEQKYEALHAENGARPFEEVFPTALIVAVGDATEVGIPSNASEQELRQQVQSIIESKSPEDPYVEDVIFQLLLEKLGLQDLD